MNASVSQVFSSWMDSVERLLVSYEETPAITPIQTQCVQEAIAAVAVLRNASANEEQIKAINWSLLGEHAARLALLSHNEMVWKHAPINWAGAIAHPLSPLQKHHLCATNHALSFGKFMHAQDRLQKEESFAVRFLLRPDSLVPLLDPPKHGANPDAEKEKSLWQKAHHMQQQFWALESPHRPTAATPLSTTIVSQTPEQHRLADVALAVLSPWANQLWSSSEDSNTTARMMCTSVWTHICEERWLKIDPRYANTKKIYWHPDPQQLWDMVCDSLDPHHIDLCKPYASLQDHAGAPSTIALGVLWWKAMMDHAEFVCDQQKHPLKTPNINDRPVLPAFWRKWMHSFVTAFERLSEQQQHRLLRAIMAATNPTTAKIYSNMRAFHMVNEQFALYAQPTTKKHVVHAILDSVLGKMEHADNPLHVLFALPGPLSGFDGLLDQHKLCATLRSIAGLHARRMLEAKSRQVLSLLVVRLPSLFAAPFDRQAHTVLQKIHADTIKLIAGHTNQEWNHTQLQWNTLIAGLEVGKQSVPAKVKKM